MQPGMSLGHYRLLDRLGAGGMGEVWAAQDLTLDRRIALKVLPEDLADDRERRERFVREAKAVAALNHPNVVTIHSVEEDQGKVFLTMELVEGSPLSRRIAAGALPLGELFDLAIPLADALAAAHERGIVHRDLKPDNVMVASGRVKVLDFGLAKLLEPSAESELSGLATALQTEEGKILGTVAYMSPEQAQGKVVDHRSDIFSLGVILYEMATGRRPFEGDTKLSVLTSLIRDTPAPINELNRAMPRHLGRIVRHCLEKAPDRRYQSALDVRNELESLREEIRSGELGISLTEALPAGLTSSLPSDPGLRSQPPHSQPPHSQPSISSPAVTVSGQQPAIAAAGRGWLPIVAVVALAAATAVWWFVWRGTEPARDVPVQTVEGDARPVVAVLPFGNTSGGEGLDWLRDALPEMLVTDLSQAAGIRVVGSERVREILDDMGRDDVESLEAVRQVAERTGAGSVVVGSFLRAGDRFRLTTRIIDAASGEVVAGQDADGEGEDSLFASVDTLSRWVRGRLEAPTAASAAPIDRDLTDVSTNSVEAFRFYAEGLKRQDRSQYQEAIPFFEEAVRLDPDFALAYVKLSVVHGNVFNAGERNRYAELALERADRLSERERYYLEGSYYGNDPRTFERAIAAYEKALELYPDDTASRNNMAIRLGQQHRHAEAIAQYEEAIRRGTTFEGSYGNLASSYVDAGRVTDAERLVREYVAEHPDSIGSLRMQGDLGLNIGDLATAERAARQLVDADPLSSAFAQFRVHVLRDEWDAAAAVCMEVPERIALAPWFRGFGPAMAAAFRGRMQEAVDSYLAVPESAGSWYVTARLDAAGLQLQRGNAEAALELALAARPRAADVIQELDAIAAAAVARAALGRATAADALLREHQDLSAQLGPHERGASLRLDGELKLASDDATGALESLRAAEALLDSPLEWASVHAAIWFDMARAQLQVERSTEAEELFRRIAELGQARIFAPFQFVRSFYWLGKLRAERGDDVGARAAFERFVELWGDGDVDRAEVAEARAWLSR